MPCSCRLALRIEMMRIWLSVSAVTVTTSNLPSGPKVTKRSSAWSKRRSSNVLARLISQRGAPTHLRSDNGPEFVSHAIQDWIVENGMNIVLNDPGKPWQNGTNESFNGTSRDECLSLEWFRSRDEAKVVIETWRRHYNEVRPHSSLEPPRVLRTLQPL